MNEITPQQFAQAVSMCADGKRKDETGYRDSARRTAEALGLAQQWETPIRLCCTGPVGPEGRRWASETKA